MKKILALALALVLALSLGVTAFADVDLHSGIAGGSVIEDDDAISFNWVWDVFETTKKSYCRIGVDFRYEDDIDIYVCPNCVGDALDASNDKDYDKWDGFVDRGWDFDDDSFEVFAEGPFTYSVKKVTLDAVGQEFVDMNYYVNWNGADYPIYTAAGIDPTVDNPWLYIYAKLDDHNEKAFYKFPILSDGLYHWGFALDKEDIWAYILDKGDIAPDVDDLEMVTDEALIKSMKVFTKTVDALTHTLYRIRITPVDDYGTKVVRGSIYFKMIDYNSGITAKFQSAPLYLDFYHTDVYDDDVKDVAGEKKAMVLDNGIPYDNSFDCGTHDHEGGYTITAWNLFTDDLYDYDFVYGYLAQEPDVVSKEHFDEGVGKTLKITDLDYTWRLEMAKVAEYQPSVNFTFNTTVADVIKGAFPDAKFQAVNFLTPNDGVIYKTASKLYIKCDAKALAQKGEDTVYAYKYVGGVLEYQDAFEVNYYNTGDQYVYVELAAGESLGSYYLSDTDLRAAAPTEENPNTGANDVVGVAVALAVVSLVAAAAVSLKK